MVEYKNIKLKVEEHTAILTLSHPPVNALSPAMLKEISAALDDLNTQKNVRALIITAAGSNAFCAGADIKEVASAGPGGAADIVSLGHETFSKLENFRAPTIAAINNLTLGGGLELALACDMRISSDRARFGFPEVTLGLIPSWGGSTRLPRIVGRGRAKEMIYTGAMINAQEALRIGLVNKVVPDGDEVRAAQDIAKRIATKSSPVAVSAAKRAINAGSDLSIEDALNIEVKEMLDVANSKDLQEGITAFVEKRQPVFKGE